MTSKTNDTSDLIVVFFADEEKIGVKQITK